MSGLAAALAAVVLTVTAQPPPTDPSIPASPPPEVATDQPIDGAAVEPPPVADAEVDPEVAPTSTIHEQPPGDPRPPTSIDEELNEIRPSTLPVLALKKKFDDFAEQTNIRLGFASTFLFQQASGGEGFRSGAAGDLDILAKWTALGKGTKDTGIVAFAGEYRFQIGDHTPSELGGSLGTLTPTTNGFGERPMVVKELYWDQRLFEDKFRYAIGRIDPENLFGGHRLQSANLYFLNKVFSGNTSVAYPGSGLAAAAQIKPVPWFYLTAGITDANGKVTVNNIEGFFEDAEFLTFGEAGFTPTIDGLGAGRYRLAVWHIDSREDANKPSDRGFTLSFDQDIGESLTAFIRYGYADGDVTNITNSIQGGIGIKHVFGRDNMLGLAAAWSQPTNDDLRDEKVLEIFQRFQVTATAQFTVGAEAIFEPSNAPDDDVLGVFSARLRISF